MEKILFPMQYMRITTGVNMLSHLGSNAIDIAGKDTTISSAFAPFTGTIKRIYPTGNTVWLESNNKVLYADGTVDFATVSFTHDSDVSNLRVGQVIAQGQVFYQEGTSNATGAHIHLEIGRGKFSGNGWYKNSYGNLVINNSYTPWNAFWLKDDTIILNGMNYPWKREETMTKIDEEGVRILSASVLQRPEPTTTTPDLAAHIGGDALAKLKEFWYSDEGIKANKLRQEMLVNYPLYKQQISILEKQLAEKPKEIIVEKPVEVIREVIKEVPVEIIKEVEVVKEVVKGDEDRTFGDLLSSAFRKLFGVK